jgi:CheY-like chemotaxis protein
MKPKRTILCVDDNEQSLSIRKVMLETRGYRVIACNNAQEALQHFRQGGVDLVLTDLVMPDGVSGRDLAHRLQARSPTLKIILTSGYGADISPRSREARLGPSFLAKPCSPRTLLEAVRTCLDG